MSFQAYLDSIRKKTGKGPNEFRELARRRGYLRPNVKPSEIIQWLKSEFDLGHGHSMAIYGVLRTTIEPPPTEQERFNDHFKGRRERWRDTLARLLREASAFGDERPSLKTGDSYLSMLRNGKKFALIKIGVDFLDLGLKLGRDTRARGRLATSGAWNRMVTHRVRLTSPSDLDEEVLLWLRAAYDARA